MITIINDIPDFTAGFRASGEVTKEDYEKVLMPHLEKVAENFEKINFLLVLDTNVGNFDIGAWIEDIKAGLQHFSKWNKMAIVTEQKFVSKVTDMLSPILPGKTKGFDPSEEHIALQWVSTQ